MPFIKFKCECGVEEEKFTRETSLTCPSCNSNMIRTVSRTSFRLKGHSWLGKNQKTKDQMLEKRERVGIKQAERLREQPMMTLAPNVNGEQVDTWVEAQKLAKDKGIPGDTYTPYIEKERAK